MALPRFLLATYLVALAGVATELLLIGHFEDWQQFIPLALIGLGIVAGTWFERALSDASRKSFTVILALMAVSGVLGQVLHYRGNMEFEVERDPAIGGWRLFAESMTGATPALAPGTMVLLAAIGWAYMAARRKHG